MAVNHVYKKLRENAQHTALFKIFTIISFLITHTYLFLNDLVEQTNISDLQKSISCADSEILQILNK